MKHTRTFFLFLLACNLLPAQTTLLFEGGHYKLLKIEMVHSVNWVVQDKQHGQPDQVIYTIQKGYRNPDSISQISCNDTLISYIDHSSLYTNWRTAKYFPVAEDKEYPQKFFLYTKEFFWPVPKRDYPAITNDSLKAKYIDCWANNKHWKHINNTFVDGDRTLITPGCYTKRDSPVPRNTDRVLSNELLDPFTLKRTIKRYTVIDENRPSLETVFEQVYQLDVNNYGSKLISERKID